MTYQVAVRYINDERTRGIVGNVGHTGSSVAAAVEKDDRLDAFPWFDKRMPTLGEEVKIEGSRVTPLEDRTIFAKWNSTTTRNEVAALKAEKAALVERLQQLSSQEKRVFHEHLLRQVDDGRVVNISCAVNRATAREHMLADFSLLSGVSLTDKIVLVPQHAESQEINRMIQQDIATKEGIIETSGIAHGHCLIHAGDRIQCFRDADPIRDGDLGEVIQIDRDSRTLAVALDRHKCPSQVTIVPLSEYPEIDLGYATVYDRASKLDLYQACVFADSALGADLVASLSCKRVAIYSDQITAVREFSNLLREPPFREPDIDPHADPIVPYLREIG